MVVMTRSALFEDIQKQHITKWYVGLLKGH